MSCLIKKEAGEKKDGEKTTEPKSRDGEGGDKGKSRHEKQQK